MYSQNNEDDFYIKFFENYQTGVQLEIGAYDAKTLSNSRALIERGWTSYLVDASPFCITKLFEVYKQDKNVHLINSLITKEPNNNLISFYESPFSAVSSIEKEHTKKYFADKEDFEKNNKEIFLPSIDLSILIDFILYREEKINFLSIDVEGFSADLALCLDLSRVKPDCICIEHDYKKDLLLEKFGNFYDVKIYNSENLVLTLK